MSAKEAQQLTPKYRAEAARLVIDTGRPFAEVAREIGFGEQLLAAGSPRIEAGRIIQQGGL